MFSLLIIRSHGSNHPQCAPISPTSVNLSTSRNRGFGIDSGRGTVPPFELQVGVSLEQMTHSDHMSKVDHDKFMEGDPPV